MRLGGRTESFAKYLTGDEHSGHGCDPVQYD